MTGYGDVTAFRSATVHEDNGIGVDPGFTDALNSSFTLNDGSLCIGKGDPGVNITPDYSGEAFKSPPSVGAYEYY